MKISFMPDAGRILYKTILFLIADDARMSEFFGNVLFLFLKDDVEDDKQMGRGKYLVK